MYSKNIQKATFLQIETYIFRSYVKKQYSTEPSFCIEERKISLKWFISGKKTSQWNTPLILVKWICRHWALSKASLKIWAPPITKMFSIFFCKKDWVVICNASWRFFAFDTPSGKSTCSLRLKTMLILPGRGLYWSGKDSQVFLPIMTAFILDGSFLVAVISLNRLRSADNRQGSFPSLPIPDWSSTATTISKKTIFILNRDRKLNKTLVFIID